MTVMRYLVLGLVMAGLACQAHATPEAGKTPQLPSFRVTTKAGKQSMTAIRDKLRASALGLEGYGKPCANNVAAPRWTAYVGDQVLAAMDCPAANDGGAESIFARFAREDADTPTCFGRIKLMQDSSYYYLGGIASIQPRALSDQNFILAITLTGGDAGVNWMGYTFVHLDQACRPTMLAQFYGSVGHDVAVDDICKGIHNTYRFTSDTTVEIDRFKVVRCKGLNPMLETRESRQTLDLQELLRQPKLRITVP